MNSIVIFVLFSINFISIYENASLRSAIECKNKYNMLASYRHKRSSYAKFHDEKNLHKRIWNKPILTYAIMGQIAFRNQTNSDLTKNVIRCAFEDWQRHSPYKFYETLDQDQADLKVIFTRDNEDESENNISLQHYQHDCDRKLKNSAAHAYFADHPTYSGEIHVNNEYIWLESSKPSGSISLKTVILHEIGHTLGLIHSMETDSIMYPFIYTNELKNISRQDDIDVHMLYRRLCDLDFY
jgi:hypothetical protein